MHPPHSVVKVNLKTKSNEQLKKKQTCVFKKWLHCPTVLCLWDGEWASSYGLCVKELQLPVIKLVLSPQLGVLVTMAILRNECINDTQPISPSEPGSKGVGAQVAAGHVGTLPTSSQVSPQWLHNHLC